MVLIYKGVLGRLRSIITTRQSHLRKEEGSGRLIAIQTNLLSKIENVRGICLLNYYFVLISMRADTVKLVEAMNNFQFIQIVDNINVINFVFS